MRDILFRGKRVDNGEWVYGSFIPDLCELLYGNKLDGFIKPFEKIRKERLMVEVDRKTVGQYTGLKDKKFTRIFEGDVVRFDSNKANLIVNFSEFSWQLILPNKKYYRYWLSDADNKRLEVIGNIFDNPELLEGDKT